MKKVFRVLSIIIGCFILLSIPAAFIFGSTKHTDLDGTKKEKVTQFMNQFVKKNKFHGTVLVTYKGKTLLNRSYGFTNREEKIPFHNNVKFPIGSVTKSMTAISILQLEQEGKLSVKDKLSKYFPDFPKGEKITIHQILNHTSGLGDYLTMKDYMKPYSDEKILNLIYKDKLHSEPGEKFSYVNSGYYLLGRIIEKVSGVDYSTYLQKNIFDKAKMSNTEIMNKENNEWPVIGYENEKKVKNVHPSLLFAFGSVLSTKEDLIKYIDAIESHQLLSEEETNKMLKASTKIRLVGGYGYGWYVMNNAYSLNEKLYSHGGSLPGLRSGLMRYQDQDLTIVIFTNKGESFNYYALGNEIASIIFDKRIWFYQKIQ
ncbi:serine hydrolase domain-containing protein [Bacillus massilinigeriensis]|uniref:serine hydrolase domain-containing protein n=1 Tax=Bacillus massilionigeriensis TaxID=1805475 RepID=UPI00096B49A9|nr:serine hydrolase domain-containing protein [Bacillus massilionigeriensis]